MKFLGVMAAMEDELSKFRDSLDDRKEMRIGGKTFYIGNFNGIPTIVVWSGWGKVASASTASILFTQFDIASLVFIGVAGATNPDLNIGDVVISTEAYQHDMDATPLMPKYQIPLVGKIFFDADTSLQECAANCTGDFLSNISTAIPAETLTAFGVTAAKAVSGIIASGDTFVTTEADLRNLYPGKLTQAVEMEGAAVAQICDAFEKPYVIIRTISDKANTEAHVDFPTFVKQVAAEYSFEILCRMTKTPLLQAIAVTNSTESEADLASADIQKKRTHRTDMFKPKPQPTEEEIAEQRKLAAEAAATAAKTSMSLNQSNKH